MSSGSVPLRVGIIGCGLMGRTRAAALGDDVLVAATDLDPDLARALVDGCGQGEAVPDVEVSRVETVEDYTAALEVDWKVWGHGEEERAELDGGREEPEPRQQRWNRNDEDEGDRAE